MAIKKAKAHYHNGTGFDVLHYETQASQVKILDSNGNVVSNIEEILLKGKLLQNVNLNTIKETGLYRVKGGTNLPTGMDSSKTYIMTVVAIDNGIGTPIVIQQLYDHINQNVYQRSLEGTNISLWHSAGRDTLDKILELESDIGSLLSLSTLNKSSLVSAINEIKSDVIDNNNDISDLQTDVASLNDKLSTHNHDSVYLKLSGGDLTGTTSVSNNMSFAGKNTSGYNVNIGKVNTSNEVVLGDTSIKTVIQASNGDLKVFDGTNSFKVFHAGNDGHGSGMDADTVDGIHGSSIARIDTTNYYQTDQFIQDGKSIVLKAPSGSSQAGSIFFRDGDNNQKGRIYATINGDLAIFAGTINGHTFQSTGELLSTYKHVLDATSREVRIQFKRGSDAGIGLYMNTSGNVGMYDWENAKQVFTVDRSINMVQFHNGIMIQGKKVYVQSSPPSNPSVGDIWFDI